MRVYASLIVERFGDRPQAVSEALGVAYDVTSAAKPRRNARRARSRSTLLIDMQARVRRSKDGTLHWILSDPVPDRRSIASAASALARLVAPLAPGVHRLPQGSRLKVAFTAFYMPPFLSDIAIPPRALAVFARLGAGVLIDLYDESRSEDHITATA